MGKYKYHDKIKLKIIWENKYMEEVEIDGVKHHQLEFTHKDYKCKIIRRPDTQHLSGYVYLKPDDDIDEIMSHEYDVHGGISYVNLDDRVIGFDCSHLDDTIIRKGVFTKYTKNCEYRDLEYVKDETKKLVNQIIENLKGDVKDDKN